MGLKLIVNATEDFTGEFRKTANTQAQWKMNDSPSGDDTTLHDSSGYARNFTINGWSGTTASTRAGKLGKYFRFNTVNPATEKSHLRAVNTGDFFTALGKRIVAGGWIYPTTYSVGTTFVPIFSTRSGPGNPLFYLSLRSGRLRNMLYDSSGTLIHDVIEPEPMGVVLKNNGAYFIGTVIDLEKKTVQSLVCDRSTGDMFKTAIRSFTGELNPSCTADIVMGMYADSYYFAGGFDDWFYETDSDLTIDDLEAHFLSGLLANGADVDSSVDAISNPGSVTLKQTDGVYEENGVLYTRILDLGEGGLAGAGKIQLVGTVDAGITSISEVKTRTSDSLEDSSFSDWEAVGTDGVIQSPNLRYIQIQMTLSTTDTSMTPELSAIQIYETPKAPYSKLGYARPVVLSDSGIREAVLENAYDIIVTRTVINNIMQCVERNIPFSVHTVLSDVNARGITELGDFLIGIGVKLWRILIVTPNDFLIDKDNVNKIWIEDAVERIKEYANENRERIKIRLANNGIYSGRGIILLNPEGKYFVRKINEKEKSIVDINNPKFPKVEQIMNCLEHNAHIERYLYEMI